MGWATQDATKEEEGGGGGTGEGHGGWDDRREVSGDGSLWGMGIFIRIPAGDALLFTGPSFERYLSAALGQKRASADPWILSQQCTVVN